jgi:DNA-binding NarL/FixJ family response regulator
MIMTRTASPQQEQRMAVITVLIADKHPLFRRSLRQLCEINGGFRVVAEATTAVELVALAAHWRPAVVLADMQLAELDGTATTRLLLVAQPDLIMILLAFAWEDATLDRARRSGARAWLAKDCAEATLFAVMRTGQPGASVDRPSAGAAH